MLFDTHTHLNDEQFDADRDMVIRRALEGGVTRMMIASYDVVSMRKAIEISQTKEFLFCSGGIHPHHALNYTDSVHEQLRMNLRLHSGKLVAIGEIGLDFHYQYAPATIQMEVFIRQVKLAREYNLPIIVHNRKASEECMAVIDEFYSGRDEKTATGVFHHFSGDLRMALRLADRGFYLSFAGPLTFKNARKTPEVLPDIPPDRILIETDCPYLAPEPFRGRRNEPLYVRYIAQKCSEILNRPIEWVEEQTTRNACRCFLIPMEK